MPEMKQITIEIPVFMLEEVDEIVRDEAVGFVDRDEFMREAIRAMIVNYG